MLIDNHVHIYEQDYSLDTIKRNVEVAQSRGVNKLGIVEHCTAFRAWYEVLTGWWVGRGTPAAEKYFSEVFWPTQGKRELEEFQGLVQLAKQQGLPVKMGIEIDYIEGMEKTLKRLIDDTAWDYVIGSVHHLDVWCFGHYGCRNEWKNQDIDQVYQRYYELLEKLICSDLCDIIAHPDLVKLFGYVPSFKLHGIYEHIASVAKTMNIAAEVNTNGWNTPQGELYPAPAFLAEFHREGVAISLASDAHKAEDAGCGLPEVCEVLLAHGITEIARFDHRKRLMTGLISEIVKS